MILPNLTFSNSSLVYTAQNAYTSMELYYAIIAIFAVFLVASFVLSGDKKPFEKLLASIMAFIFAGFSAYSTFSLAIITVEPAGVIQQANQSIQALVPTVVMQNGSLLQIVSWIMVVLAFINIVNCILVLMDDSRRGGRK